jgi:hypothetical protein
MKHVLNVNVEVPGATYESSVGACSSIVYVAYLLGLCLAAEPS